MANKFTNKVVLKKTKKNPTDCEENYEEKKNEAQSCNNSTITSTKARLVCLLNCYPDGIITEMLLQRYEEKYRKRISLKHFKCKSVSELLVNFNDVIDLKFCSIAMKTKVILKENLGDVEVVTDGKANNCQERLNAEVYSEVREMKEKSKNAPTEVVSIFKAILESYGGSCIIENLPYEYEHRTDKKLNVKELGYSTILHLVTCLGDEFGVKVLANGQSILKLIGDPILEDKLHAIDLQESMQNENKKKLSKLVRSRVTKLLTEYYPDGLKPEEIHGVYKALIGNYLNVKGTTLVEFDPPTYGAETICEMLENEKETVKVVYRKNEAYFVTPNTHQTMSESVFGDLQEKKLRSARDDGLPHDVVKKNQEFSVLKLSDILKPGNIIDVVGGDCYSADRFYVQLQAVEYCNAMLIMEENMNCFYLSEIKERYVVPQDHFLVRYPMAFYYPKDASFYRGVIISWEDLENMKVYLVDYGTEYITTKDNVYLLHKEFFKLPVQGIKTQLYGILPPDGRENYLIRYSKPFLEQIVDQVFSILIHKIENNSLIVTAYNVPQIKRDSGFLDDTVRTEENIVNINKKLVALKCAIFDKTIDYEIELANMTTSMPKIKPKNEPAPNVVTTAKKDDPIAPVEADVEKQCVPAESTDKSVIVSSKVDVTDKEDLADDNDNLDKRSCVTVQSRFRNIAKKCKEHQSLLSDSEDAGFQPATRLMTPSFSDFSTILKSSSQTNSCSDRSAVSSSRSNCSPFNYYTPQHSDLSHANHNVIDEVYELSSVTRDMMSPANEFVPTSDIGSQVWSNMPKQVHHKSSWSYNHENIPRSTPMAALMDKCRLQHIDSFHSDDEELAHLTGANRSCNIDIKCEVKQIYASFETKVRAVKHENQWYMAINEFSDLIEDTEQLRMVLGVFDIACKPQSLELTFAKHPDVFMMLCRYGANYLFTKDNKIVTKLHMIEFGLFLDIMEEIYPQNKKPLDRLRAVDEKTVLSSTCSLEKTVNEIEQARASTSFDRLQKIVDLRDSVSCASSAQSVKTDDMKGNFKLRDMCSMNQQSPVPVPEMGGLSVTESLSKPIPLDLSESQWDTRSAICGSNNTAAKLRDDSLRTSQSQNYFPPNLPTMLQPYPGIRHPPGFNQYYGARIPNLYPNQLSGYNLTVHPNYMAIPVPSSMPYNSSAYRPMQNLVPGATYPPSENYLPYTPNAKCPPYF